ncbi:MAG: hypothetical protein ACYC2R_11180 [Burkholderiales bacterium]
MRIVTTFALLAYLMPPLDAAAFDHYKPIALNESAAAYIRDGDLSTARILLERAVRLAPHDERILRNLRELTAQMEGTPLANPPKASVLPAKVDAEKARGQTASRALHEPPAIWKKK